MRWVPNRFLLCILFLSRCECNNHDFRSWSQVYSVRELFHYVLEASHRAYTPGSPSHVAPLSFFQRGTGSIRDQQLHEAVQFSLPEGVRIITVLHSALL